MLAAYCYFSCQFRLESISLHLAEQKLEMVTTLANLILV